MKNQLKIIKVVEKVNPEKLMKTTELLDDFLAKQEK